MLLSPQPDGPTNGTISVDHAARLDPLLCFLAASPALKLDGSHGFVAHNDHRPGAGQIQHPVQCLASNPELGRRSRSSRSSRRSSCCRPWGLRCLLRPLLLLFPGFLDRWLLLLLLLIPAPSWSSSTTATPAASPAVAASLLYSSIPQPAAATAVTQLPRLII